MVQGKQRLTFNFRVDINKYLVEFGYDPLATTYIGVGPTAQLVMKVGIFNPLTGTAQG